LITNNQILIQCLLVTSFTRLFNTKTLKSYWIWKVNYEVVTLVYIQYNYIIDWYNGYGTYTDKGFDS